MAVGLEPLPACLVRLLPVLVPWLVVVRLGRLVCLLTQHVPPVVSLVQQVQRRRERSAPS